MSRPVFGSIKCGTGKFSDDHSVQSSRLELEERECDTMTSGVAANRTGLGSAICNGRWDR